MYIYNIGVTKTGSMEEIRRHRLTNISLLISILSSNVYNIVYVFLDFQGLRWLILFTLSYSLWFIVGLGLSSRGYLTAAKLTLCIGLTLVMTGAVVGFVGTNPGHHIYFLLFSLVPILIWSTKDWYWVGFFFVLNVSSFFIFQYYWSVSPSTPLPIQWIPVFQIFAIGISFSTIFFVLFVFQSDAEKRQHKLESLMSTKNKFFSLIAHDIKNPLAGMMQIIDLLQSAESSPTKEEADEYIQLLGGISGGLYTMLDSLLIWVSQEQDEFSFHPQVHFLSTIRKAVEPLVLGEARAKSIQLLWELPENGTIYGDENMILSIFRNLIGNSLKYSHPGDRVTITAKITTTGTRIIIRDTGIGMDGEQLGKLFTTHPLNRTKGTGKEEGSGLGLLICKGFVDQHGGTIEVKSRLNEGTTFDIIFPGKGIVLL